MACHALTKIFQVVSLSPALPESLSFFPGNEINLPHIKFCLSALIATHGDVGGETCMDVLVTIADVKLLP